MSGISLAIFAVLVLSTSFIAGVFGMAGGMILMGGLLMLLTVSNAMVIHGITQMAANGWRTVLWREHIDWSIVGRYVIGLLIAAALFSGVNYVPDETVVFLFLGIVPFLPLVVPPHLVPQVGHRLGAEMCGFVCTSLQFLSGVSGPILDVFFVKSAMDRRRVVATKAACQVLTHLAKLIYFGFLIGGATAEIFAFPVILVAVGMAIVGTTLSRRVLEALSDQNFRRYTQWLILGIGSVYLVRATIGFL
jgi:uncharacterized membrane protein YfcA